MIMLLIPSEIYSAAKVTLLSPLEQALLMLMQIVDSERPPNKAA